MRCLAILFPVLVTSALAAQSTPPDSDLHPDKQRVLDEVLRKRDNMRDGKIERFNVRVRVKLNNGAKLNGVVKNGRLVEREEGIDFVETDRKSADAGIRLYYFDETTSFVFLRWADIATHKVVMRLTDDEVRAIEKDFAERERKRQELQRQLAAQVKAEKKPGPGEKGDEKADGPADPPAPPLLTEFPKAEGWGEAKLKEIERRKVVLGVYPNAKEKRFIEVFDEWNKQAGTQGGTGSGKSTMPPRPGN